MHATSHGAQARIFESSRSAALFQHYRQISGMRPMPSRADLDPSDFKRDLPYVYLVKVVDQGGDDIGFRISLMGTELVLVLKRDYTGQYVREMELGGLEAAWRTSLLQAWEHRTPMVALDRVQMANGTNLEFEHLALPLADDQGNVERFFGCFDFLRYNDDWINQNADQIDWSDRIKIRVPKRLLISHLDISRL